MYKSFYRQIPNFFTLGNLVCGTMAILSIFHGELQIATQLVILAAILDFFDGFLARALKVSGEFGKQLDSMADLVTFGVAPAFMLYSLSEGIDSNLRYAFVLLAVFSAYRLAKFNIDTRQTSTFIGVPTPITGIMCVSWAYIDNDISDYIFNNEYAFLIFCLLVSVLLISSIRLPSLKLKKGPVRNYFHHLILLVIGLITLIFYGWLCIPVFYAAYVLSSIIVNFAPKKFK